MNYNRGQYNESPMYNLKNKRAKRKSEEELDLEQGGVPASQQRHTALSLLLSMGLPVLFVVSLLVDNTPLRLAFLGLTGLCLLVMWLKRAFVRSARNTLTVVYLALAAVIALAVLISQTPETRGASASAQEQTSLYSNQDGNVNAYVPETPAPSPEPEAEAENTAAVSEAQARLEAFFEVWASKNVTEMKNYCLPSWVNEQQSPETVLFQMLRRSTPVGKPVVEDTAGGADGANSRIITVKVAFEENGESMVKRMRVILRRINGVWYIDPNSLDGVKVDEAAEAAAQANVQKIASTIAPTDVPNPNTSGITLYYNLHGGKYYHTIPNCTAVDPSYWPLLGEFPYELLNSKEYSKLLPCSKCGAPARPNVN